MKRLISISTYFLMFCVLVELCLRALAQKDAGGDLITLTVDRKSTMLFETEIASVDLATASCASASGLSCSVNIRSVNPPGTCSSCFAMYPCASGFCLRYLPGQGALNAQRVSRYMVTLRAVDEDFKQVTTVVDVHVQPNQRPYFDPDDFSTKTLHETTTLSNEGFFTVLAQEPESDPMIFSMTTIPETDIIQIDSLSGTITPTRDLKTACIPGVTALVYVTDQYHNEAAGPLAISVDFEETNDRPTINNVNREIQVREDSAVGQRVLTLATHDGKDDPPKHLTYILSAVPSTASNLFEIFENELLVKSELDYESQPRIISLSIRANDGYCDSELYTLTVRLVDINEPPFLFPEDQTLDSCEGLVDIRPDWSNASDPDENDKLRFSIQNPADNHGRFKIDEDTGIVSTTIDYDLDHGKLPPTAVLIVALTDRQGQLSSASLTIRFTDCNDNAPVYITPSRDYVVRDCWPAGSVVGTVPKAEDADSHLRQNNVFSHSGSAPGVLVQESGSLVITEPFKAGQTVTFSVYATDKGEIPGPLTSKPFYASLYTLPCLVPPTTEATSTSTESDKDYVDKYNILDQPNTASFWEENLAWFIIASLMATCLIPTWMLLVWRYCRPALRRCCTRLNSCTSCRTPDMYRKQSTMTIVAPVRRPTPPPPEKGPGFIFGWWKETYPDNDYGRQPDRKALPEASKGPELVETNTFDTEPQTPSTPAPPVKKRCSIM